MMAYQTWLSPEITRSAAMSILHFLWQGAALAAVASAGMGMARRATTRYAIAVAILALMVAAPAITFVVLQARADIATAVVAETPRARALPGTAAVVTFAPVHGTVRRSSQGFSTSLPGNNLVWLVYAWLAGVMLLSLRPASGFVALERLRRKEAKLVSEAIRKRCLALQKTLRIHRLIRYCECSVLEAPAVLGWLRPAVLLPLSAITGLSAKQLDAVIAHELTHIRRLDSFVNLFQIAAETLLFYHPAVWWLSNRMRAERENCCDDVAIAVCGDAGVYARALASMAESQAAPAMAMAANRGPLAARVARILGVGSLRGGNRGASLGASVLCLSASLLAGHALFGAGYPTAAVTQNARDAAIVITPSQTNSAPQAAPAPAPKTGAVFAPVPAPVPIAVNGALSVSEPNTVTVSAPDALPSPMIVRLFALQLATATTDQDAGQNPTAGKAPAAAKSSYIESLEAAGLRDLSIDQLIALKIQGVTAEYVRGIAAAGLKVDADEIVGLKIQGVTPEYVKELRDLGLKDDTGNVMAMKIQGITPEYVKELRASFPEISGDDLLAMKIQGVHPEYVRELREVTGLKLDAEEVIGMKIQGVSADYVRELKALGLKLDAGDITGMKIQGVTVEYVKSLQAMGFKFDSQELIGAKIQGITPEFVERVRRHGFKNLDLDKLMQLKNSGVLDE